MKIGSLFAISAQAMSVATADGGSVVKCFLAFGKDVEKCEAIISSPVCTEGSPEFDVLECNKQFVGCFLGSFRDFGTCLGGAQ